MLRFLKSRPGPILDLLSGLTRRWMCSGGGGSKTTVMSFGDGSHGALGLPTSLMGIGSDAYEPTPLPGLPPNISSIAAGHYHSLAVTSDGHVWAWGRNHESQLGRHPLSLRLGKIGKSLESSPLDSVAGKFGSSEEISNSMFEAAENLVLESIEKEKDMPIVWKPSVIEELHDVKVVDISCGLDHSLVLCCDGTLLSSGSNAYGQLGREKPYLGMHRVDIKLHPLSLASGMDHSLAICQVQSSDTTIHNPTLVSWGWNHNSQLGRDGPENVPLVVEGLADEIPIAASGGRAHSMVVTDKKELWTWGCGRNGRLGLGSSVDEAEPMSMLVEYFEGCEVMQAVAGFDHSLVLIAE